MQIVPMGSIGLHNSPSKSCFSAPREKRRILIPSSNLPYDLVSLGQIATIRVCLLVTHPWLFSAQSVPSFNFGNSFVPHVQRQDGNLTVVDFSWNTSGKSPACNFRAIINSLSNQFFCYFQQLHDPRAHTLNLSLFLSLPRASTNTKTLPEDLFFKPVSFLELLQFSFQLVKFSLKTSWKMGRFKHLVDSEEGMKNFRTKYNIRPDVGVRYAA